MTHQHALARQFCSLLFATILLLLPACGQHDHEHGEDDHHHGEETDDHGHSPAEDGHDDDEHSHEEGDHDHGDGDSWAVTAFGERYEIFAEADPLVAGDTSRSHTHVTILDSFAPLLEGRVEAILAPVGAIEPGPSAPTFTQTQALRAGIFDIDLAPRTQGAYQLFFRVTAEPGEELIDAGRVTVGSEDAPGTLVSTPFAPEGTDDASFLKEQQWQTAFATAWAQPGTLADSIHGPARVMPPAGGEVVLTAPVDGALSLPGRSHSWPYTGAEVDRRQVLFALVPRRTDAKTPAALEGEITGLSAQLETARAQLGRLEQLLELEAVSEREVDEARTRVVTLEAELQARQKDLRAEQAARRGGTGSAGVVLRAPFDARVASVQVSPGETVAAGTTLARLVARGPVWVEVRLQPQDAARLQARRQASQQTSQQASEQHGLLLRPAGSERALELTPSSDSDNPVRLVTLHPEVDARSGTVGAVFEIVAPPPGLLPGVRAEAEVLLPADSEDSTALGILVPGILVPGTTLVDDAGVDVVYVQLDGETFERREVTVLARQGNQLLISGVDAGERVVTVGGSGIRRAALMESGGGGHGHVH